MARLIGNVTRLLLRTAVLWIVDALSLAGASFLLPGLTFDAVGVTPRWVVVLAAAMVLAIVNMLVRPIVLLLARPLGWMAMFVVGYLVTGLMLWLTAWLLPGFEVTLLGSLIGGLIIAFFNTIITGVLDVNEEGSFYQNRIERRARTQPFSGADEPGRGLMMVEIDGLSYWHIKQALDDKLLPTLAEMTEEDGYQLTLVDCGLPSMTSACQAGIMFGDNHDIPAYRWYDKRKQKLYVSSSDAAELNQRYADGQGLMRGGSSIDNMFDGDAEKSMFTMSNVRGGSPEENKQRAEDVSLLMLDPYFLTRALAVFFWELGREVWEGWRQKRRNVQPRLNRLAHFYPFVRAGTCTILRDISTNIAIMDMMRSAPSIYMLYLGYDEIAHHSGPWTDDAFGDLKRLDRTFARLRQVIKEKAPRAYDLIILSDHGQSFGATFKQRYGIDIKTFIEQLMPEGTTVSQSIGGDTGAVGLQGLAGELHNVTQSSAGNAFDKAMAKQGEKFTSKVAAQASQANGQKLSASVTAYGSGNAAQVYFDFLPRKIKLSELEATYPGLVERLVAHEGIGVVFGYDDDEAVLAIGKHGTRNLHTGMVVGEDPIVPYAPASGHGAASLEKRVWQMKRVMEFPSAGDLWVISTVYPDGTVAALEELVGSHGGVGGEQTDAFIFHPPDMDVPETRNSVDVYHILNNHRGAPVVEKPASIEERADDWALSTLTRGISQVGAWTKYALRCLLMERGAYGDVARNPFMTGPAILIALVGVLFGTLLRGGGFDVLEFASALVLWLLSVVLLYAAGSILTKKGDFSRTFRAVGFAQIFYVLAPLALVPVVGPLIRILVLLMLFVSTWMGAAEAHQARGWRTLFLPVVAFVILGVGYVAIDMLLLGMEFGIESILESLGIAS
jgi:uncharacterized membrane protein YvlD (DUF360 family)